MDQSLGVVCLAACGASAIAVIVALVVLARAGAYPSNVRYSVGAALLAATPGLMFVGHVVALSLMVGPRRSNLYELATFWPAGVMVLVGPFALARSVVLARPLRIPLALDLVRFALAVGWAASSIAVALAATTI